MKCGRCAAEEMTDCRGYGGEDYTTPIWHSYDLARHKKREHPEEVKAQQEKMRQGKIRKEAERDALFARKREAVAQVDKPVVLNRYDGVEATTLSRTYGYLCRYPEPSLWARYEAVVREIAELKEQAQDLLNQAYEQGTEIPAEDRESIAAVRAAVT